MYKLRIARCLHVLNGRPGEYGRNAPKPASMDFDRGYDIVSEERTEIQTAREEPVNKKDVPLPVDFGWNGIRGLGVLLPAMVEK